MDKLMRDKENIDALNQLLTDVMNAQSHALKSMRRAMVITIICFSAIICTGVIGFFWYEAQFETVTTTTTTLSTEGDNSDLNHSDGNMYNDEAIHNEETN